MKNQIIKFAFISIVTVFLSGCDQSNSRIETFHSKLTPVTGAFGWSLGDRLPESAQIETNSDNFSLSSDFTPNKPVPPFDMFFVWLTSDHTIHSIIGHAYIHSEDLKVQQDALIQALTEKYGIRDHIHNSSTMDTYNFGTEDRSAELSVGISESGNASLFLTYTDRALRYKAQEEDAQRKADAKNSLKEDFKKQGL
jgi:hypothetical protein